MSKLTEQDKKILQLVQQDATKSSGDIAAELNMSQSPCWRRINRLEQEGLIEKKVALLSREKLAMDLVAFTTINLSSAGRQNMEKFEQSVAVFDEVLECYTMTGAWDYMLKIVAKDVRQFEKFVRNKLLNLPMIGEVHSHIAVTEIKYSTELPLANQLPLGD